MFSRSEVIPDSAQECPGVDNKRDLVERLIKDARVTPAVIWCW